MKPKRYLKNCINSILFFSISILITLPNHSYSQARSSVDKELEFDNDSYVSQGDNLHSRSLYADAIRMYSKSINIAPNQVYSYLRRAMSKVQLEDNIGALADLDFAESNFNNFDLWNKAEGADLIISEVYLKKGLVNLKLKRKYSGCIWLSKAGEKGNAEAFIRIKQLCQ